MSVICGIPDILDEYAVRVDGSVSVEQDTHARVMYRQVKDSEKEREHKRPVVMG